MPDPTKGINYNSEASIDVATAFVKCKSRMDRLIDAIEAD